MIITVCCDQCGHPVPRERNGWAKPCCLLCLPGPAPLPVLQPKANVRTLPLRTKVVLGLTFTFDGSGSVSEFWRCGNVYLNHVADAWCAQCFGLIAGDSYKPTAEQALQALFDAANVWATVSAHLGELGATPSQEVTGG